MWLLLFFILDFYIKAILLVLIIVGVCI